jgi:hypothetical protein
VDIPNAFIGSKEKPTQKELTEALGGSAAIWDQILTRIATELGIHDQEWSSYSPKHGWFMKLKLKKRTILYLGPCADCFRASFILGGRAVAAAHESTLSVSVLKALDEAPRYPEGTGLRLTVKTAREVPAILKLARIKIEN